MESNMIEISEGNFVKYYSQLRIDERKVIDKKIRQYAPSYGRLSVANREDVDKYFTAYLHNK